MTISEIRIPHCAEFRAGIEAYRQKEKRGKAYFEALELVQQNWGNFNGMAHGIQHLLYEWHWGFYRFGEFNFDKLVECLQVNYNKITKFKNRKIATYIESEREEIWALFDEFLDALKGGAGRSPVAVSKALSLLAPNFFPLWDDEIAKYYNCYWYNNSYGSAVDYTNFMSYMKMMTRKMKKHLPKKDNRSILKRIDEYNYAIRTKGWIKEFTTWQNLLYCILFVLKKPKVLISKML